MTLKEELSLSRRTAISKKQEIDAQADEEMREMIPEYIYPILRAMHEAHPLRKDLSVRVENCGRLEFKPELRISDNCYQRFYTCKLISCKLLPASLRVGKEFDLDVKQDENIDGVYIFTMTLDD